MPRAGSSTIPILPPPTSRRSQRQSQIPEEKDNAVRTYSSTLRRQKQVGSGGFHCAGSIPLYKNPPLLSNAQRWRNSLECYVMAIFAPLPGRCASGTKTPNIPPIRTLMYHGIVWHGRQPVQRHGRRQTGGAVVENYRTPERQSTWPRHRLLRVRGFWSKEIHTQTSPNQTTGSTPAGVLAQQAWLARQYVQSTVQANHSSQHIIQRSGQTHSVSPHT